MALFRWGGEGGGVRMLRWLPPPPNSLPKMDLRCPGDFWTMGALWYLLNLGGGEGVGEDGAFWEEGA